ncbi:tetratricopeptide (TPR) repeat protein [Elusimicrobium simillimum]|uniref:tetratricopeptide repeat protein n=1 Tax=Elusimicrobium simillimum TaxID=3143438 RepID=UPI003C6EB24A
MKKFLIILFTCLALSAYAEQEPQMGQDFYLNFLTGVIYEMDGNPKMSLEFFNKTLKDYPESHYLKTLILYTALGVNAQKDYAELAKEVAAYDDVFSLTTYADYLRTEGSLKEAGHYYELAIAAEPDDIRIVVRYFQMLYMMDFDKGIKLMTDTAKRMPQLAPGIYQECGGAYLRKGEVEHAINMYNRATAADNLYKPAYLARAKIYETTGQMEKALKEYKMLEELGEADNATYQSIGTIEIILKNIPAAKKYFEKILSSDPGHIMANQFMAAIAEDEQNYGASIKYLQAASNYATNADFQLRAAFYAARMGALQKAVDILAEAYGTSGKSVEIGYFYAVALQDLHNHKDAVKIFKEILKQSPSYEKARLMYGVSLERMGNYREFERQMREVLKINPDNAVALNSLGYALLEQNKKLEEARGYIERSLAIAPDDIAALDSLGWYYVKVKNYTKAEEYLLKAYNAAGQDGEIAGHIGVLYYEMGNYNKAKEYFDVSDKTKFEKDIKKNNKKGA